VTRVRTIPGPGTGVNIAPVPAAEKPERKRSHMSGYEPIDCTDHDRLESLATLRQIARIGYRDDSGAPREVEGLIEDVYARDSVEYLRTDSGEEIRLDRIDRVDAKLRSNG
jgi:Rho-binding antiterminator